MKKQENVTGIVIHEIGEPCNVRKADGKWYKTSQVVRYDTEEKFVETRNTVYRVKSEKNSGDFGKVANYVQNLHIVGADKLPLSVK